MAFSGNVSQYGFDARKVIEAAYRRCRLPPQAIPVESAQDALDELYLFLSELGNGKTLSWAVDKQVLPFYQNNPVIDLPPGTLDVLSVAYRTVGIQSGTVTTTTTSYKLRMLSATYVATVGIKWSGASTNLTLAVSNDDATYTTVATWTGTASAGDIVWVDIDVPVSATYFRVTGAGTLSYSWVKIGANPNEIVIGRINRDNYFSLAQKGQQGQPVQYWYQRDIPQPVLHVWPVATETVEQQQQCIVWRHRHVMDTDNLRNDVEVPQRWLQAIIDGLAYRLAMTTPSVDMSVVPLLAQQAQMSLQNARDGDNDGSPLQFRFFGRPL